MATKELFWQGALRVAGKYIWNYGTPIYEQEWDVLVVLDSCRADLMQEVSAEYNFLPDDIPTTNSVGSFTGEWVQKNFSNQYADEMAHTAYVTGNPHSDMTDPNDWAQLSEVWRHYRDEIGIIHPRVMTDHAIATDRRTDFEQMIVHYMQPHQPFRSLHEFDDAPECLPRDIWRHLQLGTVTRDDVWEAYKDNLRWVLDDINLLFEQLDDRRIVITSDHGNALGEWALYGHSRYLPTPQLKRVPWITLPTTETTDTYEPKRTDALDEGSPEDVDIEQQLEALGYR
ncbi:alkaline phosphatase family protein [Halorussus amylolyticus]|uniref:hypothetical protein n=1 Tax=Halorussus amylolyticus TaxID=1126242 RepID=UPI001042D31B|nr:hypothetical protein [Halorussus amylolyticus]